MRFGVVFWAGTRLLHRKRKTHARVDSVASLETMISTTPRAPAAGEALEKVFPTTFSGPREVDRKTDFEPGSGMREGCSGMAFTALGSGPRGVGHCNSIVSEYIYPSAKAFRDSDRRRSPNRSPQEALSRCILAAPRVGTGFGGAPGRGTWEIGFWGWFTKT